MEHRVSEVRTTGYSRRNLCEEHELESLITGFHRILLTKSREQPLLEWPKKNSSLISCRGLHEF